MTYTAWRARVVTWIFVSRVQAQTEFHISLLPLIEISRIIRTLEGIWDLKSFYYYRYFDEFAIDLLKIYVTTFQLFLQLISISINNSNKYLVNLIN